jgi:GntR family histidine utilization transcriptional repressor
MPKARKKKPLSVRAKTQAKLVTLPDSGASLVDRIEQAIHDKIATGSWRAGDRIPNEMELVEQFGASRATVNKALSSLAASGFLVRRRKAGSFVAPNTEMHSVFKTIDVRSEIESKGQRYSFRLIDRVVQPNKEASLYWPDLDAEARIVALTGVHYADDAPQVLEERLINLAFFPGGAEADFSLEPPSAQLLKIGPCTRLENMISARLAEQFEARILRLPFPSALLVSERKTWSNRVPVTLFRLNYPGSTHSFVGHFSPVEHKY